MFDDSGNDYMGGGPISSGDNAYMGGGGYGGDSGWTMGGGTGGFVPARPKPPTFWDNVMNNMAGRGQQGQGGFGMGGLGSMGGNSEIERIMALVKQLMQQRQSGPKDPMAQQNSGQGIGSIMGMIGGMGK